MNKNRGVFSYGALLIDKKMHAIIKSSGKMQLSKKLQIEYGKTKKRIDSFKYYLGHTQAPTSSERTFTPKTSHPFSFKDWHVAHNGVLTNYKQLCQLLSKKSYNAVDTSVIPPLLDQAYKQTKDEIAAIRHVLGALQGTFGLWIYNHKTHNIYIARSGSTIYADFLTNSFSSIKHDTFHELEEGLIYLITPEGITSVGKFIPNSPFFTK